MYLPRAVQSLTDLPSDVTIQRINDIFYYTHRLYNPLLLLCAAHCHLVSATWRTHQHRCTVLPRLWSRFHWKNVSRSLLWLLWPIIALIRLIEEPLTRSNLPRRIVWFALRCLIFLLLLRCPLLLRSHAALIIEQFRKFCNYFLIFNFN